MKKTAFIALFAGIIIGVALFVFSGNGTTEGGNNVVIQDGIQIISIRAKGGYSPRYTEAKAGMPTVIKVDTRGTFDCSSAIVIPDLRYSSYLPASGSTEIEVPPQKPGTKMQGLCAMGMYNFEITFS